MSSRTAGKWPFYGFIGIILVMVFWLLNWNLTGLRTHWGFFPMWLGYCLTIDALTYYRKGESLLTRNTLAYMGLFLISAPAWWLFEMINNYTQYWHYTAREQFTDLEYYSWASLDFSTVIPAVFGTAEYLGTYNFFKRTINGPEIGKRKLTRLLFFISGWIMLVLLFLFPEYGAAFLWISIFFIIDPVNYWISNRSILSNTALGNWSTVIKLWTASLICGFFWEFWNYYSNPKWYYTIPGIDLLYVFEMPLPGYLGYLPFSLELFALYHFVIGITPNVKLDQYVKI